MVSPGPKILYGAHVLGHLKNVMEAEAINRPLIVSGPNVWRTCGGDQLMACLPAHIKLSRYSDYSENPRMEDVDACIDLARDTDADAVIGIGGGTAMDLAKSTAVLSYQPGVAKDYVTGTRSLEKPRRLKLILAPTTSGSGSEMTSFAVIYVEACKYSLDDPMTQADWAIVDPSLTTSAPANLVGVTGLDAFCQAVESYWANRSTVESRAIARQAIELIWNNLGDAIRKPGSHSRAAMAEGAMLAGRAINITRTTGPHALSYPLTSLHGVPHGQACALTLSKFLVFNSKCSSADVAHPDGAQAVAKRIRDIADCTGAASVEDAALRIDHFISSSGLKTRLCDLVSDPARARQDVLSGVNLDRLGNNPRAMTQTDIASIMSSV